MGRVYLGFFGFVLVFFFLSLFSSGNQSTTTLGVGREAKPKNKKPKKSQLCISIPDFLWYSPRESCQVLSSPRVGLQAPGARGFSLWKNACSKEIQIVVVLHALSPKAGGALVT